MNNFITKTKLNHNQKIYLKGSSIELEDIYAGPLLAINAIIPAYSKTNPDDDKKGSTSVDTTLVDVQNGGSTAGNKPPAAPEPKEYEFMKDKEQVEYLKTLSDTDFKLQFNNLFEQSKTNSKKAMKARIKALQEAEK